MIKVYRASSFAYTPWADFVPGDLAYLNKNNIFLTNEIKDADLIIAQNMKKLYPYLIKYGLTKKFLIWTLEPRFDFNFTSIYKWLGLFKVHVMNVYTGDVFISNLSICVGKITEKLTLLPREYVIRRRNVAALMSHYQGVNTKPIYRFGSNIDLISIRTKIVIEGYRQGIIDIYGKGWPGGMSKEDSRDGAWTNRKQDILNEYAFNLCFENTASSNYVTEKIWDSIRSYSLPIYYGKGTNIYDLFPNDSFIDYAVFESPQQLFSFIMNISDEEYINRMNNCIDVYNNISKNHDVIYRSERLSVLDAIVKKIDLIFRDARVK
jgi:hypothetical protein